MNSMQTCNSVTSYFMEKLSYHCPNHIWYHRRLQTFTLEGANGSECQKSEQLSKLGGSGGMPPGNFF